MNAPSSPSRVLILFAHPALQRSRVNRTILRAVADLDAVTWHDLYEAYPDFGIDIAHEQRLLLEHDVIVFHHPLYWYSTPALLKEWQDLVLTHGWAYGHEGTALRGKVAMGAVTSGGSKGAYDPTGMNRRTVREFLAPLEQTARLCGMRPIAPFIAHGTHSMTPADAEAHARDYRRLLTALSRDQVSFERAETPDLLSINDDLDRVITEEGRR